MNADRVQHKTTSTHQNHNIFSVAAAAAAWPILNHNQIAMLLWPQMMEQGIACWGSACDDGRRLCKFVQFKFNIHFVRVRSVRGPKNHTNGKRKNDNNELINAFS